MEAMIKGCSAFRVGEASLLLLEHQLAGQASDLTHVWRPAGALSIWSRGRHLPALPLLYSTVGAILTHSAASGVPAGILHASGALVFAADA